MGKQLSIIEEISAEDFGYAEYKMSVRNGLEDFFAKPLAKFHYTLLMTRWAEMPPLARKCYEIFMPTFLTFHSYKSVVQDTTV